MGLLAVILYPFPTTILFNSIAFQFEVQSLREYQSDLPILSDDGPNAVGGYDTNFDETKVVVIPCPNLHFVLWAQSEGSNEAFMIRHREHEGSEQSIITPSSPTLHFLVVPCHLHFSFPRVLFCEEKLCLASTRSL